MADFMFTWDDIADITGGEWVNPPSAAALAAGGGVLDVVDDSRARAAGALFVAIRGEIADGHDYVQAAVENGAAGLCVETTASIAPVIETLRVKGIVCIAVPDSLAAFQSLAAAHRARFRRLVVVGITGSCGKTSTKEMIASVLEQKYPGQVLKTLGNTNNHFGVPRNLLRLRNAHRAAVIEMGSNHPGEIASLVALARPEVGVVSNIGPAHLEFFGDLAGVAREKGDMLAGTAWSGVAVYPRDAAHVEVLRQKAGARRVLTFGEHPDSDIGVQYLGASRRGYRLRLHWRREETSHTVVWDCGGAHQALNAGAAAAVGTSLGMAPEPIIHGLEACTLPTMRMERRDIGGAVWINDAYNANPASMNAALEWFREAAEAAGAKTLVLVLGDMLELGEHGECAHRELLQRIGTVLPAARVITVGPQMALAAENAGVINAESASQVADTVQALAEDGTWILLKGSRALKLETLLPDCDP